jgi:hypothetical protein
MSGFDRGSLDRLLPAEHGAPDWDDVLSRSDALRNHRRRRLVVVAVTALVVTIGTATALATVHGFSLDRGFVGLPPEGATPSAPETGELVVSYRGHGGTKDFMRVYADGRLIWSLRGPAPRGATPLFTGLLEQRLTPEGVELIRAEIVSTGLVGEEYSPSAPSYTPIEVRQGDRLVPLTWSPGRVVTWSGDLVPLIAKITDPAAWLPASAWQNPEVRAYVPSKYKVCWWSASDSQPIDPSRVLAVLPPSARSLIHARGYEQHRAYGSTPMDCSDLATEEARALVQAFDDAGLERARAMDDYVLTYRADGPGPSFVEFNPYLPDGESAGGGG